MLTMSAHDGGKLGASPGGASSASRLLSFNSSLAVAECREARRLRDPAYVGTRNRQRQQKESDMHISNNKLRAITDALTAAALAAAALAVPVSSQAATLRLTGTVGPGRESRDVS